MAAKKKTKFLFPIRFKFLAVLLGLLLSSLAVFFYFAYATISEDKKVFVMDLNLSNLRAATSEIKLDLGNRLGELQLFVPRVFVPSGAAPATDPFSGLSPRLPQDLLGVTFYRRSGNKFEIASRWVNAALLKSRSLPADLLKQIDAHHPVPLAEIAAKGENRLLNRSFSTQVGALSFVVDGNFLEEGAGDARGMLIVVDLDNGFVRQALKQSQIAQTFLVNRNGTLLVHPSAEATASYAAKVYPHPIVQRLKSREFPRESLELEVDGEPYLCNVSETGYPGIFAVAQIRRSEAFLALTNLLQQSGLVAILILFAAALLSFVFSKRLTQNISRLRAASEAVGAGRTNVDLDIRSRDEIGQVADSFRWMVSRIDELLRETAEKARFEEELETARLVQSTLLTIPRIDTRQAELVPFYKPATECGGDFWDAHLMGDTLTVFIGDATGHGAPAAIVTAVAKSCFATLNSLYTEESLKPEQFAAMLNLIIHSACQGKLLMTMCIIQISLTSGEVTVCNAGHESPFCVRAKDVNQTREETDKKAKISAEVLFARGERLGFDPDATFESTSYQLESGDTLMLYTDGISEARNTEGKEWGERALKKAFCKAAALELAQMRDEVVGAVEKHIESAAQEDDITFVLLRYRGAARKVARASQPIRIVSPGNASELSVTEDDGARIELEQIPDPQETSEERERYAESEDWDPKRAAND